MITQSKYQPILTIGYMISEPENKVFDRKSSKVKASDLAPIISAFANAIGDRLLNDMLAGTEYEPLCMLTSAKYLR